MKFTLRLACLSVLCAHALSAQSPTPNLYDETKLRTLSLRFPQSDWWTQLKNNYSSKTKIAADLTVDGVTYKNVGVRFRGNTSYTLIGNSDKKPFKIIMDEYVPGQTLYGFKTINLNNSFLDPSYVRETLGYHIMRQFTAAPKANYVKLELNGQNWGVYINVQQINGDFLKEWMRGDEGNRYRGENKGGSVPPNDSALKWLGWGTTKYAAAYELKNNTPIDPWKDLINVCYSLNNNGTGNALRDELPKVLDVDSTIRYLIGINMLPVLDTYIGKSTHNFYVLTDSYHKRMRLVPWDMNACLGGEAWMSESAKRSLSIWYRANESDRPLLNKMLAVPEFRARYIAHYKTIVNEVFRWDRLQAKAEAWRRLIEPELANDPKKLYSISLFRNNLLQPVNISSSHRVSGIKPFIDMRRAHLLGLSEFRTGPTVEATVFFPQQPTNTDTVTVLAKVSPASGLKVSLFERTQGHYVQTPMFDDGRHGDLGANDGIYGAQIPPQTWGVRKEFYVEALSGSGSSMRADYGPKLAEAAPMTYRIAFPNSTVPLRISEFMAKNVTGLRDSKNEVEDWIEIHNPTGNPIDISGYYLTDDLDLPRKWAIPAGFSIPGGGTQLFFADGEPADGPNHTTFKLDADGEEIALFEPNGNKLVDVIVFRDQLADRSTGRLMNADPNWVTFGNATPNASNVQTCGVRSYSSQTPWLHTIEARFAGAPRIGSAPILQMRNAQSGDTILTMLRVGGSHFQLTPTITLLTAPPAIWNFSASATSAGGLDIPVPIPNDPQLVGFGLFIQGFSLRTGSTNLNQVQASNGLHVVICR